MAINKEWRARLKRWLLRLQERFIVPLSDVEVEFFVTKDDLTLDQVRNGVFEPCPVGTQWGGKWEYGWFRTSFTPEEQAKGKRLVFFPATEMDTLVFVNGQAAGTTNHHDVGAGIRKFVQLTRDARVGETLEILTECYAGHGPRSCCWGPMTPGHPSVPEPPEKQLTQGQAKIAIFNEEAYQLWLDASTLLKLRDALAEKEEKSLRVQEIDQALRDFTLITDLELPEAEFLETVAAARTRLAEMLEKTNGPTMPTFYGFGHGHLDVAWLWPLQETHHKAARTLATQLALIDEYPDYKFMHSQPALFEFLREDYPDLWERVKQAVAEGRIIADGAMWVEADTNISGGEALIRQCLYGKRYIKEKFGLDSRTLWLPDVFGYSGALPQILKGCGVDYFATAKIFWNYYGGEPFPYNTFYWKGIDGTAVLSHIYKDYNSGTDPGTLIGHWEGLAQNDHIDRRLLPFGWGDGGGGPDRSHLEFAKRANDMEGCPKFEYTTLQKFFEGLEDVEIPYSYHGELYFQAHRGVYTSQAKTKKGNRKSELALREGEFWAAVATGKGYRVPVEELDRLWKLVLVNQFHDILPGSSIARVYEEAEAAYAEVIREAGAIAKDAAANLTSSDETSMTLFNSLNWDRQTMVALPEGWSDAEDANGNPLASQTVEGQVVVQAHLPAAGYTSIKQTDVAAKAPSVIAEKNCLENELIRVCFNSLGQIVSMIDKTDGQEFIPEGQVGNDLMLYKDVPSEFDAWDLDSMYELQPVELEPAAEVEVISSGSVMGVLRVKRMVGQSPLTQDIILAAGSRMVEFRTSIDWAETHKLLKVGFSTNIHADEALHEIQFGHLARPTRQSRQLDHDRFEVANQKWTALAEARRGLAVLNDCKFGVSTRGGMIALTLLKSPIAPDMHADKGLQELTYAVSCWSETPLCDASLVRDGYELNIPPLTAPGAAETTRLMSFDADNIILEALKPAEDGSGDIIMRLYESMRTTTHCTLRVNLPISQAVETNMLEEEIGSLELTSDGAIMLTFRPFEIKTIRLKCKA